MSMWSQCHGVVVLNKGSRLSIRKCIEAIYDEVVVSCKTEHEGEKEKTTFSFSISLEGLAAAEAISKFVEIVSSNNHYVWSEIHSDIQWT
mgnify:CR=1 FL=1